MGPLDLIAEMTTPTKKAALVGTDVNLSPAFLTFS